MADVGTLIMKIESDTKKFTSGNEKVIASIGKLGKAAAIGFAAVGAGAVVGGKKLTDMASDAAEMYNKYNKVFAGMTDDVDEWAKSYAKSVGRSVIDTKEAVSNIADLQQGLGMTKQESFALSKQVVSLATDLASFNNVNDAQAIEAVSKAMLGEAESAKQLGLLLNVDRVKKYVESQGLVYKELTDAEKAQQIYNLAVEQSQNAIGDAESSSGEYANQIKAMKSQIKDFGTELGMKLLPIALKMVKWVNNSLIPAFEKFSDWASSNLPKATSFFKESFDKILGYFKFLGDGNEDTLTSIGDKFKTIFTQIGETIQIFIKKAIEFWNKYGDDIMATAKKMFEFLINVIDKGLTFISNLITVFNKLFKGDTEGLAEDIKKLVDSAGKLVLTLIEGIFKTILNVLKMYGKMIYDKFVEVWSGVFEKTKEIWSGIKASITDTIDGVLSKISKMVKAVQGAIDTINIFNKKSVDDKTPKPFKIETGKSVYSNPFITGQRANGGDVEAGKSYLVGEKGSEIFTPGQSGTISNGDGINITITGNTFMSERDVDRIGNELIGRLRLAGVRP